MSDNRYIDGAIGNERAYHGDTVPDDDGHYREEHDIINLDVYGYETRYINPQTQDRDRLTREDSATQSNNSSSSTRIRELIASGDYQLKGALLLSGNQDRLVRENSKNSVSRYSDISSTSTRTRELIQIPNSDYQLKGSLLLRQNRNKISSVTPPRTPPQPPRDHYGGYPRRDWFMSDSPRSSPGVTRSSDVRIGMEKVITTPPTSDGHPGENPRALKPKPKLMRRKSLNPRMVTPPGLEVLDNKGLIAIRQQMELDLIAGCGASNTYKIKDIEDEQIFFAAEESSCMCRWACGPNRKFSIELFSTNDDPVLNFRRFSCRCDCCCCLDCFLCLQKLYVVDSLGRTIGSVKQKFSVLNTKFDVLDHDSNPLFKIVGPNCPCRCSTDIYFPIYNKTGERQIGRIQKKWGGDGADNVNVDHEYLDVTFPERLDAVDKALIIGAAFLINVMYMEMS